MAHLVAPRHIQRRYRILGPLGEGGLATAYRVWDEAAEEERALKLVEAGALGLLRHEFTLLAGLFHPRMVRVHDFGVFRDDGALGGYYTANLLPGMSLGAYALQHGWEGARAALADALEGLAFLHGLGIRHGDFKPDNVIVHASGRGTLLDLSCASRLDTAIASLSGTPGFMAPETRAGAVVDARADLYGVGCTLRELAGDSAPEIGALIERLCAPRAEDRPGAVADVLAALGDDRELGVAIAGRSARLRGRVADLTIFEDLLDSLLQDVAGPRGLVLHGPPGIGKSRLLKEMKWRAQLQAEVAAVPPAEDRHPRGAFRSLLRRAGASLDPRRGGLDSILRAADELNLASTPCALFIDDADRLADDELVHVQAVLRSLPEDARTLVVITSSRPIAIEAAHVLQHEVSPLSLATIQAWASPLVAPSRTEDLSKLTGGNPAYLECALSELASGRLHEDDLAGTPRITGDAFVRPLLAQATVEERQVLAMVVAADGAVIDTPPASALERLSGRGLLIRDADGHRLARPADRDAIERGLGRELMTAAFGSVAAQLRTARSPEPVRRMRCLARSGQVAEAMGIFVAHAAEVHRSPRRWSDALAELLRVAVERSEIFAHTTAWIGVAEAQLELGRNERALSTLARVLRHRPDRATRDRVWRLAGTAQLRAERPIRAVRYLERALVRADLTGGLAVAGLLVRALNQVGDYAAAAALARQRLQQVDDPSTPVALELRAGLGIAATYLGETALAKRELNHVAEHLDEAEHPRDAARVRSYLAIVAFRSGELAVAATHYARALHVAEHAQLSDMLPTLVLNLGTARHQLGDWGQAITLYEKGHRVARALGKTHAQAILELNLANLFADVGLIDRARAMLQRARASVRRADIDHLDGHRHNIAGEIALADGDGPEARSCFEHARQTYRLLGQAREEAEASLNIVFTDLTFGGPAASVGTVAAAITAAARLLVGLDASDLSARMSALRALHELAAEQLEEASVHAVEALALADASGLSLVAAEGCVVLARIRRAGHQAAEAAALEERARGIWSRVVDTLPRSMRDAFWRHPRRRSLARAKSSQVPAPPHGDPSAQGRGPSRLRRVLELSARVSSTLLLDRVLELAMDAAIELTGAERGFLMLAERTDADPIEGVTTSVDPDGPDASAAAFRVAVARNVDRQQLRRGELEFSTGIASSVMRTGEALLTLDARGDRRLADNRSVHAMRLQSVACVPVAAHGVTLGALYLDNRFEQGRFTEDDLGVVLAFANHIAMAIRNAQLHAELEQNHRRLAVEKRRVERLSRGQARQIRVLRERVRTQQKVLEHRYEYATISHRSPAMRAVLDVLDRVIDSDLTVLVEGESGTGKELIARTIHFNSPRKEGPFVGVNCGALSETLLESELFGHTQGAFTGADRDREGLMAAAQGGTLFLDEVGELSLAMQVKLLRAIHEREVRPLGAVDVVALDVRVVCATNRHLRDEVAAGRFREDLYYRLGVVEVVLPPLRDRPQDIMAIARVVLERQAHKAGLQPPELGRDAVRALLSYRWPGNVRQLENVLARAAVLSDRSTIREADLDLSATGKTRPRARTRDEFEQGEAERIHETLLQNRWNVSRTARTLGMPRNTLYRKMRRLSLTRPG